MSKTRILGLMIIIIGTIIILSPKIMNEVTDFQMNEKINEFIEESNNMSDEIESNSNLNYINKEELYEKLKEYNENLVKNGQHIVDAFSYQDVSIDLRKYRV